MYDVMNHPETGTEREAAEILQRYYDDIVIDNPRLHPDDDFESIFEIMAQQVYDDYGR
jgi:hypothetical protein